MQLTYFFVVIVCTFGYGTEMNVTHILCNVKIDNKSKFMFRFEYGDDAIYDDGEKDE